MEWNRTGHVGGWWAGGGCVHRRRTDSATRGEGTQQPLSRTHVVSCRGERRATSPPPFPTVPACVRAASEQSTMAAAASANRQAEHRARLARDGWNSEGDQEGSD